MSAVASDLIYLRSYLSPLQPFLARDDITDIYINRPGEVWTESLSGGIERHAVAALDAAGLSRLSRQIGALSHQGISREHPLLAATLPDGSRIQIVSPPATRADMALAIRKHMAVDLTLADYVSAGAFETTLTRSPDQRDDADKAMAAKLAAGDLAGLLALAVKARKNILVSGGTSTGKTTFLNTLMAEIPAEERLILIEDTPELRLRHENAVGLVAARSALGEADVTTDDLLAASLRMRPDRIIVGELRGAEAYTFLRAINTGHPGSMTTIHADSPERAIDQLALLTLQACSKLGWDDAVRYIRKSIDIVVQLQRDNGLRTISAITLG